MGKFNPDDYTTVDERLKMYREDYPDYRVKTKVTFRSGDGELITIKAAIYKNLEEQREGLFHATGIASETYEGYVNSTSRDENCETSAIGRALANAGYTGKGGRPSKEEMEKVKRLQESRSGNASTNKTAKEPVDKNEQPKQASVRKEPSKTKEEPEPQPQEPADANSRDEFIESCSKADELIQWWQQQLDGAEDENELREQYYDKVFKKLQTIS